MKFLDWVIVIALLVVAFGGSSSSQTSSLAVVYESAGFVPAPYVYGVLKETGIPSRIIDQHVEAADGQPPANLAAAIEAAQAHGLPALVFLSGSSVSRVISLPQTRAALLEAVQ